MSKKILVLASGGLDSTTLLFKAVKEVGAENVAALNSFYGQRHSKEAEYFEYQCNHLGIKEKYCLDLSNVFQWDKNCTLLGNDKEIKHSSYEEQLKEKNGDPVDTFVPFRNGLFLSVAASVAYSVKADVIWYGAHKDDAAGNAYPDCSKAFTASMFNAIWEGTGGKIKVEAPLIDLNKSGVVALGIENGMVQNDFNHTWSCYEGKDKPCGTCATCVDRSKALEDNGLKDEY